MADLLEEVEVHHDSDLKCPVCEEPIPVVAVVEIKGGSTRKGGSAGFRQPIILVNLDTEVVQFKIEHKCSYENPED